MSSKSAPSSPDFQGAAQQETNANRPNQTNAIGGTSTWNGNTQTSGFSGPLAGASQNVQQQAANNMANPFSYNVGNGDQARDAAVQGAYAQSTAMLNPQFAQAQEQQNQQLANQGLDPNSAAAKTANSNLAMQKQQAYQGAMNNAETQGTAAQQATFGENLQAGQFAQSQYGMPMQELAQLQGLSGQAGFNQAGNYLGAAQDQGQYGLQAQQMSNAIWGDIGQGLGGIASAATKLSDERTKQNIQRSSVEAIPGVPLAAFEYKAQPGVKRVGVIAQDLEKKRPDLVKTGPDGLKRVPNKPPFAF